ncbi:helix-turn-helix domain-containing protein, partial [Vibrio diabolicus]|uniref:helix-turn-helix domain-containing protein n=1 Tax=Vibrio diabolicus TaxID=50719 RepID=UPI00211B55E1|nr:AraC family transcriptional regulator [Vibrio diabolicus]
EFTDQRIDSCCHSAYFAEQRLSENIQSITDIALQLGYAETAVFSRHFRSWTGKSPSQWRQDNSSE